MPAEHSRRCVIIRVRTDAILHILAKKISPVLINFSLLVHARHIKRRFVVVPLQHQWVI